jgi:hypothetical protein
VCPGGHELLRRPLRGDLRVAQTNCAGVCRDLSSDNANCGACGNVCGAPEHELLRRRLPHHLRARASTSAGASAATCRPTSANCGGCGTVCPAGSAATRAPACRRAPAGRRAAPASASTLQTDRNNCGACGNVCGSVSNAQWSQCCTLNSWHGNTVTVPTTLGQQFGYIDPSNTGYNGGLTNTTGERWGCQDRTTPAPSFGGCTVHYVACR